MLAVRWLMSGKVRNAVGVTIMGGCAIFGGLSSGVMSDGTVDVKNDGIYNSVR